MFGAIPNGWRAIAPVTRHQTSRQPKTLKSELTSELTEVYEIDKLCDLLQPAAKPKSCIQAGKVTYYELLRRGQIV
ncbi:MAG TPA: hypothetical protein VGI75_06240 [Pirellulales bacterium]